MQIVPGMMPQIVDQPTGAVFSRASSLMLEVIAKNVTNKFLDVLTRMNVLIQ